MFSRHVCLAIALLAFAACANADDSKVCGEGKTCCPATAPTAAPTAKPQEERLENVGLAFGLATVAGLSTTFGSALVFWGKYVQVANKNVLAYGLAFAAGVMVYVSFCEIVVKGTEKWAAVEVDDPDTPGAKKNLGEGTQSFLATLCFFSGIAIVYALDWVVHRLQGGAAHSHDVPELDAKSLAAAEARGASAAARAEEGNSNKPPKVITAGGAAAASTEMVRVDLEGNVDDNSPTDKVDVPLTGSPRGIAAQKTFVPSDSPRHGAVAKLANGVPALALDGGGGGGANGVAGGGGGGGGDAKLQHMGVLTALAICLHNFPEGLITFIATVDDPTVGFALCVAIGIHNIPEGLCVSIPVYYATGDRRKAFLYAFFSGVTELLGALLGYAVLLSVDEGEGSHTAYAVVFGLVAGMMVAISLKELLPTAYRYAGEDREKYVTAWIWAGAFMMAMSLVLFAV